MNYAKANEEMICKKCGEKMSRLYQDIDLIELFTKVSQVWFSFGVKYGILHERKDFKSIKKMEEKIRSDPEFLEFYTKSVNYAKENLLTKLQEKDKDNNANAH